MSIDDLTRMGQQCLADADVNPLSQQPTRSSGKEY
jgi:hypothetical protein